jgi:hypothetical protein
VYVPSERETPVIEMVEVFEDVAEYAPFSAGTTTVFQAMNSALAISVRSRAAGDISTWAGHVVVPGAASQP